MKYDKQAYFELEQKYQQDKAMWLEKEKKYSKDLNEERTNRIKADTDYNNLYGENINLRNNLEIEKSEHGKKLKKKSIVASNAGVAHS